MIDLIIFICNNILYKGVFMENNQNKKKTPKGLIILGVIAFILLAGGITMVVISSTSDTESPGLIIGGSFAISFGFMLTFISLIPLIQKGMIKLNKHIIEQNKQDLKDISSATGDIASDGVKTIAKSATEGHIEAMDDKKYCKNCGKIIDNDSKFCSHCGTKQ